MSFNKHTQPTAHPSVDQMAVNSRATVLSLIEPAGAESKLGVVGRLVELGFLQGETATVLRRGPGGREPIAVQIGETVFALRSIEASCIQGNCIYPRA
jgi:ferrous iron transport protein A